MKVKYRLPIIIVVVSFVPLLILMVVAFLLNSTVSQKYYKMLISNQSIASEKYIWDFYSEQRNGISYSANIETYRVYLEAKTKSESSVARLEEQAKHLLTITQQVNASVDEEYIANLEGTILISSNGSLEGENYADNGAFAAAIKNNSVAHIIFKENGKRRITLACPVKDNNNVAVGVLLRNINIDAVTGYISSLKIGERGYMYILDGNGDILSRHYSDRMPVSANNKYMDKLAEFTTRIKNKALTSKTDYFEYYLNNEKLLANYRILPETGWVVVSAIPFSEITKNTIWFNNIIIIATLLVSIIALIVGLASAKYITKPLHDISYAVKQIADGKLDTMIQYKGNDEFGELCSDIGVMTHKLGISYKKLSATAKTDMVTGLPNRAAVYAFMDKEYDNTKNQGALLLDLDGFKVINDTLGHDYGDKVLIAVAEILKGISTQSIMGARLGGDEFFVYISHFDSKEQVIELGKKLLADITEITWEKNIKTSASVGIAFVDGKDTDKSRLIKKADLAMYEAKKSVPPPKYSTNVIKTKNLYFCRKNRDFLCVFNTQIHFY